MDWDLEDFKTELQRIKDTLIEIKVSMGIVLDLVANAQDFIDNYNPTAQ
jgi:hypothetical protein